jgi:ribosomal protein L34E
MKVYCEKCGSNDISCPDEKPESIVTCDKCGAKLGTLKAYRQAATAHAEKQIKDKLKKLKF